jgi:hypothetical protein
MRKIQPHFLAIFEFANNIIIWWIQKAFHFASEQVVANEWKPAAYQLVWEVAPAVWEPHKAAERPDN